jgi:hypothetical protein
MDQTTVYFCCILLIFSFESYAPSDLERVSDPQVGYFLRTVLRLKTKIQAIDYAVQEAEFAKNNALEEAGGVAVAQLSKSDLDSYERGLEQLVELRKDLFLYVEIEESRSRWCSCFCVFRSEKNKER